MLCHIDTTNHKKTECKLINIVRVIKKARGCNLARPGACFKYAESLPEPTMHKLPAVPTGKGPLDGIRVLDLGLAIAGPFGCQLLGDMGAEVIKMNTLWDSYWHKCHIAAMANRNKRSFAVMLKHPKGMEALKRLIATCDVVQHNMRPYNTLHHNDIYCTIVCCTIVWHNIV